MAVSRFNPQKDAVLLAYQANEATEAILYRRLARVTSDRNNARVLQRIADDERKHYAIFRKITGMEVPPHRMKISIYYWISRILGLTFGIKLMERGEGMAVIAYGKSIARHPALRVAMQDEGRHERELIAMIEEEKLRYAGSIVLGLNDALVELTGALAGFTLALQKPSLVAMAGAITGIAASLSMAASEYLSQRTDGETTRAFRSALYTGTAYVFTVIVLVAPFVILNNSLLSLGITLFLAILIILAFNFYLSVARDLPFWRRFREMAFISLGVALISFLIGYAMREVLGIQV
jgi:VIT1/CCC1 family predicted Fe2+/Mn2+ transporter